jgi:hypothetical protein
MKATGPSVLTIKFDPDQVQFISGQAESLAYHLERLLTGKETADSEWTHLGLEAAVHDGSENALAVRRLTLAADFLDDGFHDKLVDELRAIADDIATLDAPVG